MVLRVYFQSRKKILTQILCIRLIDFIEYSILTSKHTDIVKITCLVDWLKGLSKPVFIILKTDSKLDQYFFALSSVPQAILTQSCKIA